MADPLYRQEEWLRREYVKKGRSMRDLADDRDTTPSTIKRWLDNHGIETRNQAGNEHDSIQERFWSKVDDGDEDECWEWTAAATENGYGLFYFRGRKRLAHHAIWRARNGVWPRPKCLHHCDNPSCVNPNHLYEGDQSQNNIDAYERNRREPNDGRPKALDGDEVSDIRQRAADGEKGVQQELAEEYGVSEALISKVVNERGAYDKE